MSKEIEIQAMPTPNPNSIKFLVNQTFFEFGSINFDHPDKATSSPLPKALMDIEGMDGVMIGKNFISISKTTDAGWETILEKASSTIKEMLSEGADILDESLLKELEERAQDDREVVKKIKEILDDEIRPAIAMDGGDCQFHGYEDGILTLELQGACSTCPSATLTLKMGIENRLKQDIPELEEVVQV